MASIQTRTARIKRHVRVRGKVQGTMAKPRLCVFRSSNHIYAQVIDDVKGHTMASASTLEPDLKSKLDGKKKVAQAELIGALIAERAKGLGIEQVAFDRGGFKYHGRVKAVAESARKAGLTI
ncbi:MAG: 50S ribosomal protein L18 [Dehalococcoidales bacterium]|nr:50S ribosomal protein L18 [Dehalococcoidales bacterium]